MALSEKHTKVDDVLFHGEVVKLVAEKSWALPDLLASIFFLAQ